MSTASIDLQGTAHPIVDADPHPAQTHLQDARTYLVAVARYWVALADWVEDIAADRAVVPVLAGCAAIIGGAIVGVNL